MSEVELLFQVKERQILESCQVSDDCEMMMMMMTIMIIIFVSMFLM